ncbi:hypothetical protein CLOM_g18738 [Closterium sp. NIES-68]|nr:hypothetical protein CLOM_g18738 [Closterium sp. NIES-68]GJP74761.1 hypothetical protein CLOP_g5301 [Closterium sp. NIES-67]
MAAANSSLRAARQLLPLSLLVLLAVTSASAARPAAASVTADTLGSAAGTGTLESPHRVERKLFSWDGVTADQIISGSLGIIGGIEDDGEVTTKVVEIFMNAGYNVMVIKSSHTVAGEPFYTTVEVEHFWSNSHFTVYFKQGPFEVANTGDGGFQNWAFGGNWQRVGADDEVVLFQ